MSESLLLLYYSAPRAARFAWIGAATAVGFVFVVATAFLFFATAAGALLRFGAATERVVLAVFAAGLGLGITKQ